MGNSILTVVGLMILIGASMSAPQSSGLSDAPGLSEEADAEETRLTIQNQIYILSGTFGGILFLLIILVLGLALALAKLKTQLKSRQDKYGVASSSSVDSPDQGNNRHNKNTASEGNNHHTSSINAYVNSAFNGSSHEMEERHSEPRADLSRLGYEVYPGNNRAKQENNSRLSSTPKQEVKGSKEKKYVSRTEIVRRGDSSEDGGIPMSHMSSSDISRYGARTKWTPRPTPSDYQHKKSKHMYEYVEESPREEFKKPSLRASNQIPRARSKEDRVYSSHALSLDDGVAPRSTSPEKGEYRRSDGRRNRY